MTEANTGAGRAGRLIRLVHPVVSARTWLAAIHLLTGLAMGLAWFIVAVGGLILSIALLPLGLLGLPVFGLVLRLASRLARMERSRTGVLLDVRIPVWPRDPALDGRWWRSWRAGTSPAARRMLGFALIRLPLSLVQVLILSAVWAVALVAVTLPAYNGSLPRGGAQIGGTILRGAPEMAAAVAAGLMLLLAAPWVTRVLAGADIWVGSGLLGPGRTADLTARVGELERSRARVVDAAEAERRRIERDLHDGAQQRLVSLAMELGRARAKFGDDPDAARAIVDQAHLQAKEALAELRNLVRGVHPPVLSDRGLDAALSGLAALSPVPVTVQVQLPSRPPATTEAIAYFVVAEALTNVAKHAHASHADVSVRRTGDVLHVSISDDGKGGADPRGRGLAGLADRVAGVDGRLVIDSPAGGPTSISVELPCGS